MNLCGLTSDELYIQIERSGFTMDHAVKISNAVYKKHLASLSGLNGIPKKLIEELTPENSTGIRYPHFSETSKDGTIKYLFVSDDGKKFETVYIPEKKRTTVCVSSQSGCRMGCPFCVTGKYGFHGNLTAGEIVNQVISLPGSDKVNHVVFMGMGEPMDNFDNVLKACKILIAEWGLALSPSNITVSSVGITPGIQRFLSESSCNLTVSLFSPFFDERKKVVPIENKYPVKEIIDIMKAFPIKRKRRLTLSYIMIESLNDSDDHLEELKSLLKESNIRINLLPYHTVPGDSNKSSSVERLNYFKHNLVMSGISASIRRSRGSDISAACGLLASGLK
jgi:23S rRNA (adenine2503-C2)-methyltransferase